MSRDPARCTLPCPSLSALDQFFDDLLAHQEALFVFEHSDKFRCMCEALVSCQCAVSIDNERFAFSPDDLRARLGWDFASDEDVENFFQVMGDPDPGTVEPGSFVTDQTSPLKGCAFRRHGLHVWMLFGESPVIGVTNSPLCIPREPPRSVN